MHIFSRIYYCHEHA